MRKTTEENIKNTTTEAPKKRRGRPPKKTVEEIKETVKEEPSVKEVEEEIIDPGDDNADTELFDNLIKLHKLEFSTKKMKEYNLTQYGARICVRNYYTKQHTRITYMQQYSAAKRSFDLAKKNMPKFKSGEITAEEIFKKSFPHYVQKNWDYFMDLAERYDDVEQIDDIRVLDMMASVEQVGEDAYKTIMHQYASSTPIGRWLLSIGGIGPVIATGLMSYFDIYKAPVAGSFFAYAGWCGPGHQYRYNEITGEREIVNYSDPDFDFDDLVKRTKRERRQAGEKGGWNPDLRVLLFKLGDAFIKIQNSDNPNAIYGHVYKETIARLTEKNDAGGFATKAKVELAAKKYTSGTEAYKAYSSGKLPKSHLVSMAKRYTVKLFLSHFHEVWYEYEFGKPAPNPYVLTYMGHVHKIEAPNKHIIFE